MTRRRAILPTVVVGAIVAIAIAMGTSRTVAMPDRVMTPGQADTTSLVIICGTSTATRRNVSESTKAAVYKEYGVTTRAGYEVDHLIPLALGGSNDIQNLWPQPATPVPGFHQKDVLEVRLHALVCSGQLDVTKAQNEIAIDWQATYRRYVK